VNEVKGLALEEWQRAKAGGSADYAGGSVPE
jgi:hypothetical protein